MPLVILSHHFSSLHITRVMPLMIYNVLILSINIRLMPLVIVSHNFNFLHKHQINAISDSTTQLQFFGCMQATVNEFLQFIIIIVIAIHYIFLPHTHYRCDIICVNAHTRTHNFWSPKQHKRCDYFTIIIPAISFGQNIFKKSGSSSIPAVCLVCLKAKH